MRCYCCSSLPFDQCCKPILKGEQKAGSPEALMRSRFSAYATKNYAYILHTYSEVKRAELTIEILEDSAQGTNWFALNINTTSSNTVEFTAFYFEGKNVFQLHETSNFVEEHGEWRYHDGTLHTDCGKIKYGRNLPCLCGSGKKFKQCCGSRV